MFEGSERGKGFHAARTFSRVASLRIAGAAGMVSPEGPVGCQLTRHAREGPIREGRDLR